MTVPQLVYGLLSEHPSLTPSVPAERWFARGAVIDSPLNPHVVLAWTGTLTGFGLVRTQGLDIYVHNDVGEYETIRGIHKVITDILSEVQQYTAEGVSGRIVQMDFQGYSEELYDPEKKTAFIYSSWQLLGGE